MKLCNVSQYMENLFHFTNNGTYKYVLNEFNKIIYDGDDVPKYSKFMKDVENCTKLKVNDSIEYLKGSIDELIPFKINSGTESIILNNTPFSVLKLITTSPKQLLDRNTVPTSVPYTLRAIIEDNEQIFYACTLVKVNIIPEDELVYAFKKLDIEMLKYGYFLVIGYSDDTIRVYTDGFVVIDDIGYGNIGTSIDGRLHIIDCQVFDIDDWEEDNDYKIPNKIASISYNSDSLLKKKLENDLKVNEFDIHQEIKIQEQRLDDMIKQNEINSSYTHLSAEKLYLK